jgi:hypothetical protein
MTPEQFEAELRDMDNAAGDRRSAFAARVRELMRRAGVPVMTAPVPLNPVDHPAGTRVLCKCAGWSQTVHEHTVVEWAPSGQRVRMKLGADSPHWIMEDLPFVVEVLERPEKTYPVTAEVVAPLVVDKRMRSGVLERPGQEQRVAVGNSRAGSPEQNAQANAPAVQSSSTPRDQALVERARAFFHGLRNEPREDDILPEWLADFASAEVAARDKEIAELTRKGVDLLTQNADLLIQVHDLRKAKPAPSPSPRDNAWHENTKARLDAARAPKQAPQVIVRCKTCGATSETDPRGVACPEFHGRPPVPPRQGVETPDDAEERALSDMVRPVAYAPAAPPREERDVFEAVAHEWINGSICAPDLRESETAKNRRWQLAALLRARFGPAIEALEQIRDWKLPPAEFKGKPCSFESAWGSNGARDYMRRLACAALDKMREGASKETKQ